MKFVAYNLHVLSFAFLTVFLSGISGISSDLSAVTPCARASFEAARYLRPQADLLAVDADFLRQLRFDGNRWELMAAIQAELAVNGERLQESYKQLAGILSQIANGFMTRGAFNEAVTEHAEVIRNMAERSQVLARHDNLATFLDSDIKGVEAFSILARPTQGEIARGPNRAWIGGELKLKKFPRSFRYSGPQSLLKKLSENHIEVRDQVLAHWVEEALPLGGISLLEAMFIGATLPKEKQRDFFSMLYAQPGRICTGVNSLFYYDAASVVEYLDAEALLYLLNGQRLEAPLTEVTHLMSQGKIHPSIAAQLFDPSIWTPTEVDSLVSNTAQISGVDPEDLRRFVEDTHLRETVEAGSDRVAAQVAAAVEPDPVEDVVDESESLGGISIVDSSTGERLSDEDIVLDVLEALLKPGKPTKPSNITFTPEEWTELVMGLPLVGVLPEADQFDWTRAGSFEKPYIMIRDGVRAYTRRGRDNGMTARDFVAMRVPYEMIIFSRLLDMLIEDERFSDQFFFAFDQPKIRAMANRIWELVNETDLSYLNSVDGVDEFFAANNPEGASPAARDATPQVIQSYFLDLIQRALRVDPTES